MHRLLIVLLAVLAGCATTTTVGVAPSDEMATILGHIDRSDGFWHWRSYALLRVDDTPIRHTFMSNPHDTIVHVAPGEHRLVVLVQFNTGFGGSGVFQSVIGLPCLLDMSRTYRLNGAVSGEEYVAWLEDVDTHARVGPEASAPYVPVPASAVVPIFIPAH